MFDVVIECFLFGQVVFPRGDKVKLITVGGFQQDSEMAVD